MAVIPALTLAKFRQFAETLARDADIDSARIILGGDHLGPNPWKHLPAPQAMGEAKAMVKAYVEAGFTKIHLDCSMACADDAALSEQHMASRAAELCAVAEAAATQPLAYVIGTEVPIPGGETAVLDALAVTQPNAMRRTYEMHQHAFRSLGLDDAFSRVIALVVQPGVDFGNAQVFAYDAVKAAELVASVASLPQAVFEAHSTDYQTLASLSGLVAGQFGILKVGPELTFAYREAIFAMAAIEEQLPIAGRSGIIAVIDEVMNADDRNWRNYVPEGTQQRVLKLFGFSDRVRYYWPNEKIVHAVALLQANIDGVSVPRGLLEQYAGAGVADAPLPLSTRIIDAKVGAVVRKYLNACGASARN